MMHDATGPNDPDTIEGTDTDAENTDTTNAPDLAVDPEQLLVDGLGQIRTAAIALEAREDVVLHYYAAQAIDPLEQAVTTIQQRERAAGRTQGETDEIDRGDGVETDGGREAIVPEGIDADKLRQRVGDYGTSETQRRCPDCGYANLANRSADGGYYCRNCTEPLTPAETVHAASVEAALEDGDAA